MNSASDQNPIEKVTRDTKDKSVCEQCGMPVQIDDAEDLQEEILCPTCSVEYKELEEESEYFEGGWT